MDDTPLSFMFELPLAIEDDYAVIAREWLEILPDYHTPEDTHLACALGQVFASIQQTRPGARQLTLLEHSFGHQPFTSGKPIGHIYSTSERHVRYR